MLRNLTVALGACAFSLSACGSITLPATSDACMLSVNPAVNYGNNALQSVYNNDGNIQRILIKFDLSPNTVPKGDTIASATLRLTAYNTKSSGEAMEVYRITTDWSENTATWNSPWITPGGDYVGTTGEKDSSPYATTSAVLTPYYARAVVSWDITRLVREWYAETNPNYGLLLLADPGNELCFFSREGGVEPEYLPVLEITIAAVPEPSTYIAGALLLLPFGASAWRMLRQR